MDSTVSDTKTQTVKHARQREPGHDVPLVVVRTLVSDAEIRDDIAVIDVQDLTVDSEDGDLPPRVELDADYVRRTSTTLNAEDVARLTKDVALTRAAPKIDKESLHGRSFFLFDATNSLRVSLHDVMRSTIAKTVIFLMICINIISLLMNDYFARQVGGTYLLVVVILDNVSSAFFVLESLIKCIQYGVLFAPNAYLKDRWNVLDFLASLTCLAQLMSSLVFAINPDLEQDLPLRFFAAFRALRLLRSLRVLTFFHGIEAILTSLRLSAVALGNVAVFICFFMLLFSILGTEAFGGSLSRRCVMDFDRTLEMMPLTWCKKDRDCHAVLCGGECDPRFNYPVCNATFGSTEPVLNFDNVLYSALSVFRTVSLDDWALTLMHPLMQAEYSATVLYFVAIVLFLTCLSLNLMMAVISSTFDAVSVLAAEEIEARKIAKKNVPRRKKYEDSSDEEYEKEQRRRRRAKFKDEKLRFKDAFRVPWLCCTVRVPHKESKLYHIVHSGWFTNLVYVLIFLNALTLSMHSDSASEEFRAALDASETVFFGFFLVEMILKVWAVNDIVRYLGDQGNVFDCVLTLLSGLKFAPGMDMNLSLLRVMRLLRLAWKIDAIRALLVTVARSGRMVTCIFVFSWCIVLIFSAVGIQVFGGRCCVDVCDNITNNYDSCCAACTISNFNNFPISTQTLFQITTGDSWFSVLISHWNMEAQYGTEYFVPIFFVSFYVFMSYVTLNLIVAVILGQFGMIIGTVTAEGRLLAADPNAKSYVQDFLNELSYAIGFLLDTGDKSLFLFGPQNYIRSKFVQLSESKFFENGMVLVIVLSSMLFVPDDANLRYRPWLAELLYDLDFIFFFVFIGEFFVHAVAKGVFLQQGAYLRDPWGCLDFVVLVATGLGLMPGAATAKSLRVIRLLRVLRPLRAIKTIPSMAAMVNTLLASMPVLSYVILLVLFTFFIFGILGMQLFSGLFRSCWYDTSLHKADCVGVTMVTAHRETFLVPHVWTEGHSHFNDVASAFLTLFQVATFKWIDVATNAAQIPDEKDLAPVPGRKKINGVFFVVFIFVAMFLWTLFIAVIVEKFTTATEWATFTEKERVWVGCKRVAELEKVKYVGKPPPQTALRGKAMRLVRSSRTRNFVNAVILANVLVLCFAIYELPEVRSQPGSWTRILEDINLFFLAVYTLEMLVKIFALGPRRYLANWWNVFDMFIVVGSFAAMGLRPVWSLGGQLARVFRVGRVFRLIKASRKLQVLFATLVRSAPAVANMLLFLLLVMFMFAVLGVQLYRDVQFGDYLNRNTNFRTFPEAFLALFTIGFSDYWPGVMEDLMIADPSCTRTSKYPELSSSLGDLNNTCGSPYAPLFFVVYFIIVVAVILNLFVAIVLECFAHCQNKSVIRVSDTKAFKKAWLSIDQCGTGKIPKEALRGLIGALPPPLGFNTHEHYHSYCACVLMADHASDGTGYKFQDILLVLCAHAIGLDYLPSSDRVHLEPKDLVFNSEQAALQSKELETAHQKKRALDQLSPTTSALPAPAFEDDAVDFNELSLAVSPCELTSAAVVQDDMDFSLHSLAASAIDEPNEIRRQVAERNHIAEILSRQNELAEKLCKSQRDKIVAHVEHQNTKVLSPSRVRLAYLKQLVAQGRSAAEIDAFMKVFDVESFKLPAAPPTLTLGDGLTAQILFTDELSDDGTYDLNSRFAKVASNTDTSLDEHNPLPSGTGSVAHEWNGVLYNTNSSQHTNAAAAAPSPGTTPRVLVCTGGSPRTHDAHPRTHTGSPRLHVDPHTHTGSARPHDAHPRTHTGSPRPRVPKLDLQHAANSAHTAPTSPRTHAPSVDTLHRAAGSPRTYSAGSPHTYSPGSPHTHSPSSPRTLAAHPDAAHLHAGLAGGGVAAAHADGAAAIVSHKLLKNLKKKQEKQARKAGQA